MAQELYYPDAAADPLRSDDPFFHRKIYEGTNENCRLWVKSLFSRLALRLAEVFISALTQYFHQHSFRLEKYLHSLHPFVDKKERK
jgi:hypothetical protein